MSGNLSITETQIFTALNGVLATFGLASSTVGQSVPIIRGQVNRVPEPNGTDFIVMWPITRNRITVNIDTVADIIVTGTITSNVLTASAVTNGALAAGQIVFYANGTTAYQTTIIQQTGGTSGGAGTYTVTAAPNTTGPALYAGTLAAQVPTEMTMQLDVHGPASADNAQRVTTLMRDWYAIQAFQDAGYPVAPLYTSDPRQMPFDNGEQQVEERWVVDCCLQVNPIVTVPQQFADEVVVELLIVDGSASLFPVLATDGIALILTSTLGWPMTTSGLSVGDLWANGIFVNAVPGTTPGAAPAVFFGSITAAQLLSLGATNLPLIDPQVVGQIWLNGSQLCVSAG